jgi:diamine N-acetyltransferase
LTEKKNNYINSTGQMISVVRATEDDCHSIVSIGKVSVAESHKGSSSAEIMNEFLERNYNVDTIKAELNDINNIYYILNYKGDPVGFSKIVLNAWNQNIAAENVAKLDRIYLLKDVYGLGLGWQLLNFNIELAKNKGQSGMWLYVWIGNNRAIDFYLKAGFSIIGSHEYYVNKSHYDLSHQLFLNFLESRSMIEF